MLIYAVATPKGTGILHRILSVLGLVIGIYLAVFINEYHLDLIYQREHYGITLRASTLFVSLNSAVIAVMLLSSLKLAFSCIFQEIRRHLTVSG